MERILLTGGILVTVDAGRRVLQGYDLLVDQGAIAAIAPAGQLSAESARVIDCAGCAVLPGLVDCGGWAGARPFSGWMQEYPAQRWPLIAKALAGVDADWWRAEGAVMAGSRLRSGVTTGSVHYASALLGTADRIQSHLAGYGATGAEAIVAVEPEWLDAFDGARAYLPYLVASSRGQRMGDGADGLTRADLNRVRGAISAARASGAAITAGLWGRQIELLEGAGVDLSGVRWLFQFCSDLTYAEIQRLCALDAAAAHLPRQSIRYAPFSEMLEAGLRCAIMSEDMHSGGSGDMLQAARRAQMIEQLRFDDLYYLPVGRQLELITIDAARCLGLEARKGSLEVGKDADIAVFDLEYPRTAPYRDMPVHRLMIDGNARQVRDVLAGGVQRVAGGKLLAEDEVKRAAQALEPVWASLPAQPDAWGLAVKPWPQPGIIKEVNI